MRRLANPGAAARTAQQPPVVGPVLLAGGRYSTGSVRLHLCEQDRIDLERPASGRMWWIPEAQRPSHRWPSLWTPSTRSPSTERREGGMGPASNTVPALAVRLGTVSHLIPLLASKLCADAVDACKYLFLLPAGSFRHTGREAHFPLTEKLSSDGAVFSGHSGITRRLSMPHGDSPDCRRLFPRVVHWFHRRDPSAHRS